MKFTALYTIGSENKGLSVYPILQLGPQSSVCAPETPELSTAPGCMKLGAFGRFMYELPLSGAKYQETITKVIPGPIKLN